MNRAETMTGAAPTPAALGYRTLLISSFPVVVTACVATVGAIAALVVSRPGDSSQLAVFVLVTGTAAVFGVGLSDLANVRELRFTRALIAAGLLWALSALAASRASELYSVGRTSQWLVELAIVYLVLTYPSGRLTGRAERLVFAAAAVIISVLYLPTALAVQHFPAPFAWSTCTSGCPRNAFALGDSTPGFVTSLIIPIREGLSIALFLAIFALVRRRGHGARPWVGRMYAPVVWIAALRVLTLTAFFLTRRVAPASWALPALSWAYVLTLPAVALACRAGRVYPRLFTARALDRIAQSLSTSATAAHVSKAMADALEDPSLQILHSFPGDDGTWVDESGLPVNRAQTAVGRQVTEVASGNWRIAVLHDPALSEDPPLVRSAGSYALAALENHYLTDELRRSLQDLAESRARRLTAEHGARQKIERDLHDGAQQRLVALRVKLGLAATALEADGPSHSEVIRALERDVDATIDEVRSLARGIYPPLLAQTGLSEALRGAGRAAAVPTTVHCARLGRYPPDIEATVYFACSEALQNAAKHGRGATAVTIALWQDRELHFEVRDDGAGFDLESTPHGTGLASLGDRLAAVGGTMTIQSVLGEGTAVRGSIPLA